MNEQIYYFINKYISQFFYKIKKKINFLLNILNNYNKLIYSFIIRLFWEYNYHYCNSHFKNYLVNLI